MYSEEGAFFSIKFKAGICLKETESILMFFKQLVERFERILNFADKKTHRDFKLLSDFLDAVTKIL